MPTTADEVQDGHVDVLVVDDDPEAVEELVEFLSKAQLKCVSAPNGWIALQMIAEGCHPRVVVSDLRMPELSGTEFAGRLASFPGGMRPEIVFVSGNAGFDDAIEAIRLGARDMLTKPVDGGRLVQAVKSAMIAQQLKAPSPEAAAARPEPSLANRKREAVSEMKSLRRLRGEHFPSDLFSDPCWEMLLDLYDAHLANAEVTVTSLGAASGVPQTTALRRMEALQGHSLITRVDDKDDRRRTIIRLTETGLAAVERFFESYLSRKPS